MMHNYPTYLLIFLIFSACDIPFSTAQEEPSETRTITQQIDAEGAESVSTTIEMRAGRLTVTGGAKQLMNADFTYNYDSWEPEISYETQDATGFLAIEQPELKNLNINLSDDEQVNEWVIQLNDDILQDLSCNLGAGETNLDLRGLALNSVDIKAGVGEHTIDLRDSSVPELDIKAGVGEVTLDLTGKWRNSLVADIKGGIGELNLSLPGTVGIRLDIAGGLGDVDVPRGFRKDGRVYTNDLYDTAEHTLDFEIKAGLGSINVEVEDVI
ncbi:toast rack family protein [Tunicatimonas pelagia]|uniref:toast rack family protein n=1 Tax=Tunicatimonas pelagia TaxID=931531 RepID=UPI0026659E5D|nr:toast rack family protein [Tunicatimonas pelagia]WKN42359.1 toast rack family protein [Tunicatimonas pelagia]